MQRGRKRDEPPSVVSAPIPGVYLQEEGVSDEQIPPRGGYEERLR